MKLFLPSLPLLVLASLLGSRLGAAEPKPRSPIDGTWKWPFTMRDGTRIEPKAKLKQKGQTLTGITLLRAGQETPILDGKINSNTVQWAVVREHNGRKVTTRYQGQLQGDTLKGFIESDWAGQAIRYDWSAERVPDTPTGIWRWITTSSGRGGGRGASAETSTRSRDARDTPSFRTNRATFKQDGEKVTGKISVSGRELEVKHGRFKKGEFSFQTVRERDGQKAISTYRGLLELDSIRGQIETESDGEKRMRPWQATRIED